MSFRSVLVCYTAGFTTIITTLRRITIGKEIYFLRTGILHGKIIIKIYLSENKEVTLFVQLNW